MNSTDMTRLFDQASEDRSPAAVPDTSSSAPDLDRYRPYVAHLNLPKEQEADMLLAVWRIMQNVVDRAFGDDPVQRSGYLADKAHENYESDVLPVIELQHTSMNLKDQVLEDEFHRHAVGETDKQEKR